MSLQMFIPYGHEINGLGGNTFNGENLLQYSTFFVLNFQGLITLYIPLILLFKSEGTLNVKQYKNETDDKIFQKTSNGVSSNVDDVNDPQNKQHDKEEEDTEIIYDLDIDNPEIRNNMDLPRLSQLPDLPVVIDTIPGNSDNTEIIIDTNQTRMSNNNNNNGIFVRKCLFQFLYRNQSNHCIFSDYLRFCFAIENLQFVERVSIFYQLVLKLQKKHELSIVNAKSPAMNPSSCPTLGYNSSSNHSQTLSLDTLNLPLPTVQSPVSGAGSIPRLSPANSMESDQIDMSRMSAVYVDENGTGINGLFPVLQAPNSGSIRGSNQTSPAVTPITPIPNPVNWNDLKKDTQGSSSNDNNNNCAELKYIYRFEFAYLRNINNHYEQVIEDAFQSQSVPKFGEKQHDVTVYRSALFAICKEIYDQFIDDKAISQVLFFCFC